MHNIATANHPFILDVPRTIPRLRDSLPSIVDHLEFRWNQDKGQHTCLVEWDTPRNWRGIRSMGKMRLTHDEAIALWQEFDKHIDMPKGARYVILTGSTARPLELQYSGVAYLRSVDEPVAMDLAREG